LSIISGSKNQKAGKWKLGWMRFLRIIDELRITAKALLSTKHPFLAQIVPMRRCNLSCAYCNEFDNISESVPLSEVKQWLDCLADMGTSIVTVSGGEPLLHPELDDIIRHTRRRGMIAGIITNGFLLNRERIEQLNAAGLQYLQISIDNVMPDDVSKKSLKTLNGRLEMLSERALFKVNINSVLGGGVKNPEDALTIALRARELGFSSTLGIIHDHSGQLMPLAEREREIFEKIMKLKKGYSFSRLDKYQHDLAYGRQHDWKCRAGSRYLYICENGLVHRCSQQRGIPGVPISNYTAEMRWMEFLTRKECASGCTVGCVLRTGILDNWRVAQTLLPTGAAEQACMFHS
jgi:MoaA/NifB/PqqE/SkfB family radical SAM enzyme